MRVEKCELQILQSSNGRDQLLVGPRILSHEIHEQAWAFATRSTSASTSCLADVRIWSFISTRRRLPSPQGIMNEGSASGTFGARSAATRAATMPPSL